MPSLRATRGGWFGNDNYIAIQITQPRGSELESTDQLIRHFEERIATMPEVERFTTQVRDQFAYIRVTFPDSLENTGIPEAIKEQLLAYSFQFGGPEVRVYGYGPSFYGGGGAPPNYRLQVLGYNYLTVREIALDLKQRLERFSRVRDVNINAGGQWNSYEITARGNRMVVVLNGTQVVDTTDDQFASGPIALQYGAGTVRFRNVRIRSFD